MLMHRGVQARESSTLYLAILVLVNENDNDNDTQRSPSNNCQWPGVTGVSGKGHNPAKKESLLKLMGLALLARSALEHTVDDSV